MYDWIGLEHPSMIHPSAKQTETFLSAVPRILGSHIPRRLPPDQKKYIYIYIYLSLSPASTKLKPSFTILYLSIYSTPHPPLPPIKTLSLSLSSTKLLSVASYPYLSTNLFYS
ncbi:unnamed protein product [Prunus brigantina]